MLCYLLFILQSYHITILLFQERTRSALLESLYKDLQQKNLEFFGEVLPSGSSTSSDSNKSESSKLFDTFRRAISGKVRSISVDSQLVSAGGGRKANGIGSPVTTLPPVGENDSTPCVVNNRHLLVLS